MTPRTCRRRRVLRVVAAVVVLLIVALAADWLIAPGRTKSVRLNLTGTDGQPVAGTYTVDGEEHAFRGTLPAQIDATASQFGYEVRLDGESGPIRGDLFINGERAGSSATSGREVGVRGEFQDRGFVARRYWLMFTTTPPSAAE